MSLASLLANDTITVQKPGGPNKDASGGFSRTPAVDLYTSVQARVLDAGSQQQLQYAQLQIQVSHVVLTEQAGIGNGHLILTSDGRTLRVTGVEKKRGLGGIETYYRVLCLESRPGG